MIKLARPYITNKDIEKVKKVLLSCDLIQGNRVKEFETLISQFLSTKYTLAVSSGTAALHLALLALDITKGDEVILPAFTFPAVANTIELVGAKPVFVDINYEDFCLNPSLIVKAITKNSKAIIVVHEFGQAADIERISDLAKKKKLKIIEDAACALGTEYKGRKIGTFGDIACFSFHPRKIITTGEGGALVTNDKSVYLKVKALRNHGFDYINNKPILKYSGLNYRMTEFQASLGVEQMKRIKNIIKERIAQGEEYNKLFCSVTDIITPKILKYRKNIYQTYHVLLNTKIPRDKIIKELKEKGVETNIGAHSIPLLSYYSKKYKLLGIDFPESNYAYKHGLALPLGHHISKKEIRYIVQNFKNLLME